MSFPYPQDRHRDRKDQGEQPYKDAREAMGQQEAEVQAEAEAFGEAVPQRTDEERNAGLEERAVARLREVGESREQALERESGST
jgi:hypothetical protein